MIREWMKMMGNVSFDNFFEIYVFWDDVHDGAPDMTRVPALSWLRKTIRAEMLRLESNARTIDQNVIAQCSTNNGGIDFHIPFMPVNGKESKPVNNRYTTSVGKTDKSGAAKSQRQL